MSYIGASDLVYNNKDGIYSGGFNVQSIMMKGGISPIMTINNNNNGQTGGSKVSDMFGGLVVPAFAYHNNYQSGGSKHNNHKIYQSDSDEDDVINDELHDKLLNLMNDYDDKIKQNKKKNTKKNNINKKNSTKKMKISK